PESLSAAAARLIEELHKSSGFVDITSSPTNCPLTGPIEHLGARPAIFIGANLGSGTSFSDATKHLQDFSREILPAGVSLELRGDAGTFKRVFTSFGITLSLA